MAWSWQQNKMDAFSLAIFCLDCLSIITHRKDHMLSVLSVVLSLKYKLQSSSSFFLHIKSVSMGLEYTESLVPMVDTVCCLHSIHSLLPNFVWIIACHQSLTVLCVSGTWNLSGHSRKWILTSKPIRAIYPLARDLSRTQVC